MAAIPKPIGPASEWRDGDPLLTPEQVAKRLNTSLDWVWDYSSRKTPLLPVIRLGDGAGRAGMLRFRASKIEGNSGGVEVSYVGKYGELLACGGLPDNEAGYSAGLPFVPIVNSSTEISHTTYSEIGLMAGAADPMMQFPKNTTFTPYSVSSHLKEAGKFGGVVPNAELMTGIQNKGSS